MLDHLQPIPTRNTRLSTLSRRGIRAVSVSGHAWTRSSRRETPRAVALLCTTWAAWRAAWEERDVPPPAGATLRCEAEAARRPEDTASAAPAPRAPGRERQVKARLQYRPGTALLEPGRAGVQGQHEGPAGSSRSRARTREALRMSVSVMLGPGRHGAGRRWAAGWARIRVTLLSALRAGPGLGYLPEGSMRSLSLA